MPITLLYSVIIFIALFIFWEAGTLLKRHALKELLIASLLLVLAGCYGMDFALGWQYLPNPNALIHMFQPVSESFDTFFQVDE